MYLRALYKTIIYDIMLCTLQNELREEMRIYREHLAEQAREEEKREREVDALVNSEVEKQWAKRLEQWRKEREARKKLMQDVLNERKKQIEQKREFNITIEDDCGGKWPQTCVFNAVPQV